MQLLNMQIDQTAGIVKENKAMRRKIMTLFIAFTMILSMSSVAFAETPTYYGINIGGSRGN